MSTAHTTAANALDAAAKALRAVAEEETAKEVRADAPPFKVGDRVRILAASKLGSDLIGETGVVERIHLYSPYSPYGPECSVRVNGVGYLYEFHNVEKIERPKPAATPKVGDRVRIKKTYFVSRFSDVGKTGTVTEVNKFDAREGLRVPYVVLVDGGSNRYCTEVGPLPAAKVGDRVRVVSVGSYGAASTIEGKTGVVTHLPGDPGADLADGGFRVRIDGDQSSMGGIRVYAAKVEVIEAAAEPTKPAPTRLKVDGLKSGSLEVAPSVMDGNRGGAWICLWRSGAVETVHLSPADTKALAETLHAIAAKK